MVNSVFVGTNYPEKARDFYNAAVDEFHRQGVAKGGADEGAPGRRPITPTACGAYLRDPDGNKVCAFCFADE